jgi:ribonuclease HI
MSIFHAYCDGGSRKNNLHGAGAFIICNENNEILYSNSFYFGNFSNNQSEYTSLIFCLVSALAGGIKDLIVTSDSQLTIFQVINQYQVKSEHLKPLHLQVQYLIKKFNTINFEWSSREHIMIKQCDKLCDLVLEEIE